MAMTRLYGRYIGAARVIETVPQNYGENTLDVGNAFTVRHPALMTINGAMSGVVFKVYVAEVLSPTLKAVIWS